MMNYKKKKRNARIVRILNAAKGRINELENGSTEISQTIYSAKRIKIKKTKYKSTMKKV